MTNITMLCATRPRLLKQALASIGDISDATVTIRDAGMNDFVGDIIEYWSTPRENVCPYFHNKPMGTGTSRNEVIRKSQEFFPRGEYLALLDDDVFFLQPDWLKVMTVAYSEAWEMGFRILGAYGHPFHLPINKFRLPISRTSVHEVTALATQSWFMHWSVWDTFGPFVDTPPGKVCQSEDVEMINRIRGTGGRIGVISPPLLVNTGITNSFGEHIPGWELVKSQCPEGVICE